MFLNVQYRLTHEIFSSNERCLNRHKEDIFKVKVLKFLLRDILNKYNEVLFCLPRNLRSFEPN